MITAYEAASYIFGRYARETGHDIDEMKLHKMLYFAQREAFVVKKEAMFPEEFEAWKYGPVMVELREKYKARDFIDMEKLESNVELQGYLPVFNAVFERYAQRDSWSLSNLTHSQISWKNARRGCAPGDLCSVHMKNEDIRQDAEDFDMRRIYLKEILPWFRHENN